MSSTKATSRLQTQEVVIPTGYSNAHEASWVLALFSLIVLGCLTYLFLSQGAASISAGGVKLGAGLSPSQQLFGIGIISLAIVLVNIVFNVMAFRKKR